MNASTAALKRVHRAALISGEGIIFAAVMRAMRAFLRAVKRLILPGGRSTPVNLPGWPPAQVWTQGVTDEVVPAEARVWDSQAGDWDTDTYRQQYLAEVPNRLRDFPDEAFDAVRTQLEEGQKAGESIPKLRDRIASVLDIDSGYWGWRARRIARTETLGAYNGGAFYALVSEYETSGDTSIGKQWLATDDTRTRETHDAADGQKRSLFAPFLVGGALLMYPGDPLGPAREVINCRCALLST